VQVVAADVADRTVELRDSGFRLSPVVAERDLPTQGPLISGEAGVLQFETVDWLKNRSIGERGEAGDPHVDSDDGLCWVNGLLDFPLSLDTGVPFPASAGDGDVLRGAQDIPAVAVAQPAQLGQKHAAVGLVERELFGIGVAEVSGPSFLLEAREVGPLREEIAVGPFQVLELLL